MSRWPRQHLRPSDLTVIRGSHLEVKGPAHLCIGLSEATSLLQITGVSLERKTWMQEAEGGGECDISAPRPPQERASKPGVSRVFERGRAVKTFSLFRTAAGEREPLESFYLPAKGARAFFLPPWLQGTAGIRARPSAALMCGQRLTKPTHGCAQLPGPQCQGDPAGAGRWRNKDVEPCLSSEDSGTRTRSAARGPLRPLTGSGRGPWTAPARPGHAGRGRFRGGEEQRAGRGSSWPDALLGRGLKCRRRLEPSVISRSKS